MGTAPRAATPAVVARARRAQTARWAPALGPVETARHTPARRAPALTARTAARRAPALTALSRRPSRHGGQPAAARAAARWSRCGSRPTSAGETSRSMVRRRRRSPCPELRMSRRHSRSRPPTTTPRLARPSLRRPGWNLRWAGLRFPTPSTPETKRDRAPAHILLRPARATRAARGAPCRPGGPAGARYAARDHRVRPRAVRGRSADRGARDRRRGGGELRPAVRPHAPGVGPDRSRVQRPLRDAPEPVSVIGADRRQPRARASAAAGTDALGTAPGRPGGAARGHDRRGVIPRAADRRAVRAAGQAADGGARVPRTRVLAARPRSPGAPSGPVGNAPF